MRRPRQSRTSNLDLDAPGCLGNVDRLDTHLTVDNVRFAPCAYLVADDINPATGAWPSRHDTSKILSVAGAGASPTYGNATAIENSAVKYAAAKYHAAADTTWGQITTGDGAIECLFVMSNGTDVIAASRQGASPLTGWQLNTTGNTISGYFSDGTNFYTVGPVTTFSAGQLAHVLVFMDRSHEASMYINGVYTAISTGLSALSGSIVTAGGFTVGAWVGGSAPFDGSVLCLGVWNLTANPFPGALKNRTYFDRIARERFALIAGIQDRRQGAHTFTRATSAYLDKLVGTDRKIYKVSAGWPRVCERPDANNRVVRRYLGEPQATNYLINSHDFNAWPTKSECSVSTGGWPYATSRIDLTIAPDTLVGSVNDVAHYIAATSCTPPSSNCVYSVWLHKYVKTWAKLAIPEIADCYAYFNLTSDGVVGTVGAGCTAGVDQYKGGWARCFIAYTGAGAQTGRIYAAHADNDDDFVSTGVGDIAFFGAQIEATAELFPSSYIPTAAAAVARNKDELSYNVRLPIVGNINDLPQALTIGGSDYDPCAYLVADDCQADGTWPSRHNATKTLAFAGAGTNPTPQWDSVSRANKSIKYWASNYHAAADTTWGQIADNDGAIECLMQIGEGYVACTSASGSTAGFRLAVTAGVISVLIGDGTDFTNTNASSALAAGSMVHFMACFDKSDKAYFFVNGVYFGVSASSAAVGNSTGGNLAIAALSGGTTPGAPILSQLAVYDLTANPWPGAATNQAVMGAIARARFNQLFRYQSCRLDAEILHPNVNRQAAANLVDAGLGSNDRVTIGLAAADVLSSVGTANGSAQWSMAGSTDIAANVSRKLSVQVRANSASADVDNANEDTDASCEVPAGMTRVFVGEQLDGTIQPTCMVGGVKLWRADR